MKVGICGAPAKNMFQLCACYNGSYVTQGMIQPK